MHCLDNSTDRDIGKYWERCFCQLAAAAGKVFTPLQIGRDKSACAYFTTSGLWNHWTLPDITIWSYPGEHHEIKHKSPTSGGRFGLEQYRFNALLSFSKETRQRVMYTIHDHSLNGGRDIKDNHIEHWLTANIEDLNGSWSYVQRDGTSWVNGIKKENITIYYWESKLWSPLIDFWNNGLDWSLFDNNDNRTRIQP